MKKIIITGGHFTPGFALVESLDRTVWKISWIGEDKAMTGKNIKTLESLIIPGIEIPFYKITTSKFHRNDFSATILSSWKLIIGFTQSIILLMKIRPNIILSFGSYVSVPVCFAGWILGIPIVVHEQTTASGLANRLVSKIAKKVCYSFQSSVRYFKKEKLIYTGNLVRKSIFKIASEREKRKANKLPILYITGGSRGSQLINQVILSLIEVLLSKYEIHHQTGSLDFQMLKEASITLPKAKNYHIKANFSPKEVEEIYSRTDIVISRSGANTVSELAILGIPAILIPLLNTEQNEQVKNAEVLTSIGQAVVIPQSELSGPKLLEVLSKITDDINNYSNLSKSKNIIPYDATNKLIHCLNEVSTNV